MNSPQDISIPAAVGGVPGVAEFVGSAKVFACLTLTAQCQASFDGKPLTTINAGTILGDPTSRPFRHIVFYNNTANAIDITFTVSNNAINPAVVNSIGAIIVSKVTDASTYTKAFAAGKVAAGATVTFNGLDGGKQRKQIVIQNNDLAASLSIQDNTGNEGFSLKAGQAVTLATNGVIKIQNQTVGDINCDVLETFYS